jgi:pentatricopeptide repeat protein
MFLRRCKQRISQWVKSKYSIDDLIIEFKSGAVLSKKQLDKLIGKLIVRTGPGNHTFDLIIYFARNIAESTSKKHLSWTFERYLETDCEIQLHDAIKIINLFIQVDLIPSGKLKNLLLFGIARTRKIDDVRKWIDYMSQQSYLVDGLTSSIRYNALVVASRDHLTDTLMLYDELEEKQDIAVHTFTSVLRNVIHYPDLYGTVSKRIQERGLPNPVELYTVRIQYLSIRGKIMEALGLLDKMIEEKMQITVYVANVVLLGLFENSKVDEALRFFNSFSTIGLTPDSYTFGILIHQLSTRGMFQAAIGFYEHLRAFEIPMTLKLWSITLNMYATNGDIKKVESTFEEMKNSNCQPNTYIYCIAMRANADVKAYGRVLELYQEMKDAGLPDTEFSRRYLIVACAHIPHLRICVMEFYNIAFQEAVEKYIRTNISPTELIVFLLNDRVSIYVYYLPFPLILRFVFSCTKICGR